MKFICLNDNYFNHNVINLTVIIIQRNLSMETTTSVKPKPVLTIYHIFGHMINMINIID